MRFFNVLIFIPSCDIILIEIKYFKHKTFNHPYVYMSNHKKKTPAKKVHPAVIFWKKVTGPFPMLLLGMSIASFLFLWGNAAAGGLIVSEPIVGLFTLSAALSPAGFLAFIFITFKKVCTRQKKS